jgi:hypothetical protein
MQKDQIDVNEHGDKPSLKLLDRVSDRLRVKGYSPRTEEIYRDWAKRYVLFWDRPKSKRLSHAWLLRKICRTQLRTRRFRHELHYKHNFLLENIILLI